MYKNIIITLFILALFSVSCSLKNSEENKSPSKVELRNANGKHLLYVNENPFYVKGAGYGGNMELLAQSGANSLRTWRTADGNQTALELLDEAKKNGLMVLMGIEIGKTRHGFDYNDTAWVNSQFESVKKQVLEIKDHPALLAWAIGNELNHHNNNKKIWEAVNNISKMIHKIDGNHPTTTTFAGFSKESAEDFTKYCTDLDFVSIQMYGDIINLQERIKESGFKGPYMVTEWGATGHWEVPLTEWGIAVEQTSTEKALSVKERWEKGIYSDKTYCLGSYIFLWGQKQERTPTWYGLFTEENKKTAVVDLMTEIWSGKAPENKCPEISKYLLEGKNAYQNVYLNNNTNAKLFIEASDPDNDIMKMHFKIMKDNPEHYREGGDAEKPQETIFQTSDNQYNNEFSFKVPSEKGAYRIFLYLSDGNNNAATANIQFFVK